MKQKFLEVEKQILQGLNEDQLSAVTHEHGPLLIVAGAGTGKTMVITRRIAWLIVTGRAQPEEILALTFTEKAAQEMEERIDLLLPYGYSDLWISTFHAFGDRVIKENALALGISPDVHVMSRAEQLIFFSQHIFEFPLKYFRPLGDPTHYMEAILNLIARAKDEDVSWQEYLEYAKTLVKKAEENPNNRVLQEKAEKELEIANCYRKYQELLAKEGRIDFGDQVWLTLKLLREHPLLLENYQKRFKYILVDEFQDTNHAQFELVKLLAARHCNITVTGDDDQSIYKFRGAALSNIMGFMDAYPHARIVVLTRNYRSPQGILDRAYRLIKYNDPDRLEAKEAISKRLRAEKKEERDVIHLHFDSISDEADWVAKKINQMVANGKYRFSDFAILVRSNNDADPFLRALNMEGIPWHFSGNEGLYSQPEIRNLISWLKVLTDLDDSISLYHLLSSPFYSINPEALTYCLAKAKAQNRSLFYILKNLSEDIDLKEKIPSQVVKKLLSAVTDIRHYLELSSQLTAGQLLYRILTDSGYLKNLLEEKSQRAEIEIKNIARFFEIIRSVSSLLEHDDIFSFTSYLKMLIAAGDDPALPEADFDLDAVNVLTVHKAKGLEFRVVFIVSLVRDRFPTRRKSESISLPEEFLKQKERWLPTGEPHIQEERRLFYVAMTRACEQLYLTSARDYGGKRPRRVSQFVLEALDLPHQPEVQKRASSLEIIARSAPPKSVPLDLKQVSQNVLTLSYLQIDDYLTCPLKYSYIHILKVPVAQHHTVVYGKAIHEAIQAYNRCLLSDKVLAFDHMVNVFRNSWRSEGFLSRAHEEHRFQEGIKSLERFYQRANLEKKKPKFVEKEFSILIDGNRIIGRWDRIDEDENGIKIIDYKTSDIIEQEKADKRARESLQLKIYALAYHIIYGVVPDSLELHFVDSGLIGRAAFDYDDLKETREKIREVASAIKEGNFQATPGYYSCTYCVFRYICPSTIKDLG